MSSIRGLLIVVLIVATGGCHGSVSSIVPDGAARFEPQLLGTWSETTSKERAVITQAGSHSYDIQYTDDRGQTLSLVGQLGRNRERLILDVQPASGELGKYEDLAVRLHILMILDSIGPSIHAAILEPDSLDEYLRTHPRAIAHRRMGDSVVLTADSKELGQFFATYLRRPGVIAKASTWARVSP